MELASRTDGVSGPNSSVWRKSSYSTPEHNCVELADSAPRVAVRDSKRPAQPALAVNRREWSAFVSSLKTGRFDG